ncbi:M48 family metallopeptidase [Konateibacter massiliensis]|uniref:M48 family metallopeptidase n=1 Tax=Konateibacter massiliensis TaxID=2002841 RepID=UPI0015D478E9|nr:SprT family zinc-dependent metalloprotease [Konateibacter massiliensis]
MGTIDKMDVIEHKSQVIQYKTIRSDRRSIAISVRPTREVIVRAPRQISDRELERLVKSKADWILTKLNEMPKHIVPSTEKQYKDGDEILFRGKEYTLRVQKMYSISKSQIILGAEEITIIRKAGEKKEPKELLLLWYKEQAREFVLERISFYSPLIKKPIGDVRIKSQKKRWGSCSSQGNLNFNWRIILMPDKMSDYIVVHEMCHLKYLNHSRSYWDSVASILPDYKERENWIKRNTFRLEML